MGSCKIKIYFLYSSFCKFLSAIVSSTADIAVSSLQGKVGYGDVNLIMRVSDMFVCEYVLARERGISSCKCLTLTSLFSLIGRNNTEVYYPRILLPTFGSLRDCSVYSLGLDDPDVTIGVYIIG
jgi:hypothetical protein